MATNAFSSRGGATYGAFLADQGLQGQDVVVPKPKATFTYRKNVPPKTQVRPTVKQGPEPSLSGSSFINTGKGSKETQQTVTVMKYVIGVLSAVVLFVLAKAAKIFK